MEIGTLVLVIGLAFFGGAFFSRFVFGGVVLADTSYTPLRKDTVRCNYVSGDETNENPEIN